MITNSWTRGSVAGSSLAVNGISLSRASGLNPEVDPISPQNVWVALSLRSIDRRAWWPTGLEMEDEMETRV